MKRNNISSWFCNVCLIIERLKKVSTTSHSISSLGLYIQIFSMNVCVCVSERERERERERVCLVVLCENISTMNPYRKVTANVTCVSNDHCHGQWLSPKYIYSHPWFRRVFSCILSTRAFPYQTLQSLLISQMTTASWILHATISLYEKNVRKCITWAFFTFNHI